MERIAGLREYVTCKQYRSALGLPDEVTEEYSLLAQGEYNRNYLFTHPVTGKKHQLRLHMSALGAPIYNDAFYPSVNDDVADDYQKPLQLLASELTFVDPVSGVKRHFKSEQRLLW